MLFISCPQQIEADDFEEQKCVNAILIADSIIKVHVSMAEKMGNFQLSSIENAQVFIYNYDKNYNLTH